MTVVYLHSYTKYKNGYFLVSRFHILQRKLKPLKDENDETDTYELDTAACYNE
jgi:hypothetical protein